MELDIKRDAVFTVDPVNIRSGYRGGVDMAWWGVVLYCALPRAAQGRARVLRVLMNKSKDRVCLVSVGTYLQCLGFRVVCEAWCRAL